MRKLLLLAAIAAGYVLGARAGRQRYEQIKQMFVKVKDDPRVQSAAAHGRRHRRQQAPVVKDKITAAAADGRRQGAPVRLLGRRRAARQARPRQHRAPGQPLPAGPPALRNLNQHVAERASASARASVSEATWSMTARRRPASSAAARQSSAKIRSRASAPRSSSASTSSASRSRWWCHRGDPVVGLHDVVGRDALEHARSRARSRPAPPGRRGSGRTARRPPRTSRPARLPQKRPIRSLVRFFSAARCRREPSYAVVRPAGDRRQAAEGVVELGVGRRRAGTTRARSPTPPPRSSRCRSTRPATTPSSMSCTE